MRNGIAHQRIESISEDNKWKGVIIQDSHNENIGLNLELKTSELRRFAFYIADEYLKEHAKNYLICRLSHKPYPFPYDSAWVDVITNADYTPVISGLVIELIKNGAEGLYNVGTEKKTIYELAQRTNKSVLKSIAPPHIPKNVTMNISKMENFLKQVTEQIPY